MGVHDKSLDYVLLEVSVQSIREQAVSIGQQKQPRLKIGPT